MRIYSEYKGEVWNKNITLCLCYIVRKIKTEY